MKTARWKRPAVIAGGAVAAVAATIAITAAGGSSSAGPAKYQDYLTGSTGTSPCPPTTDTGWTCPQP